MLLVLDVSNASTKIGLYQGDELRASWRIDTHRRQSEDEYGLLLTGLMQQAGFRSEHVEAIIMANVVPSLIGTFQQMFERYFGRSATVLSHALDVGLKYRTAEPAETGADRIANCLAALRLYGGPCVVVKFGTATTFDAVSEDGAFLGGAIAPGLTLAMDALTQGAALLHGVELAPPPRAIAIDTIGNLQSGIVYGYVGLVEGLLARFKAELPPLRKVVATGWEAQYIAPLTSSIDEVNPLLTLEGLRFAYEAIRPDS